MDDIVTRFDDRDPEILYSGEWFSSGTILDYLNTTTMTYSAGSGVLFYFTGTSISVYGEIKPEQGNGGGAISNYTIDSGVPYQFIAVPEGEDLHRQLLFRATGLSLEQHLLVITNLLNNTLFLDYLEIGTGSSDSSTLTTPISSNPTATATQYATMTPVIPSSFTATHYATITTLQTSSKSTTSRVGPPIGVTIGGAIVGPMIFSLVLFACFFARRRRHRKKNLPLTDSLSPPQLDMSHAPAGRSSITPFIIGDPSGLFMGPILGKCTTHGNGQGVDGGVALHCAQVPFSADRRHKSRSDFPPRCTALAL